jgi:type IV pilus assembly protein PilW
MLYGNRIARRPDGFSLVEIMVAMAIGIFGVLIIMQVFLTFQGQKRTTMSAADAQENALVALQTVERDVRMSGLGVVGLGCTTINAYNANAVPPDFTFSSLPVTITQDSPAAGTDMLVTLYSNSAFGNIPTKILSAMPDSSAILNVDNGDGFYQGNMVLVSEPPKPCSIVQASQDGQKTGSTWNLQHNPGGSNDANPPGGHNIFPAGGYGSGARLTNMGNMVNLEYSVQNEKLMVRAVNLPNSATNPIALVDGIFAIKAQYGRDTGADGYVDVYDNTAPASADKLVAVRLAVVARASTIERGQTVSPATLVLWSGGTVANGGAITLSTTDRQYRFKVYQTVIPLRNVIWNN